jgi:hypothetical protein
LLASIAAAATRTSGTSKNVTKRVGYLGTKRYISVNTLQTITAAGPTARISCSPIRPTPVAT